MKMQLTREILTDAYTLGTLTCDGELVAYTCEDRDRHMEDDGVKVYGQTAIPRGTYQVILSFSPHFGRVLPEVLDVPGFSSIRIHGGNTAADSLGCILVGRHRTGNGVSVCAPAIEDINSRFDDEVTLEII